MSEITSVVFDLGNVLIDWNPRYLYRKFFSNETEMEWFLKNICNDDWNNKHDAGESFSNSIPELCRLYPEFTDLIKIWFDRWEEMLGGKIEETVEILSELKNNGTPLYILSNWSSETFPKAEVKYDFLKWFQGKIISGQVGKVKPDIEIFYILSNTYNINPKNTVFIDDKFENINAAKLIGYHVIHYKNAILLRSELKELKIL